MNIYIFYVGELQIILFRAIINILVKDTGLNENFILQNLANSVRSVIKPWDDYVSRHEW